MSLFSGWDIISGEMSFSGSVHCVLNFSYSSCHKSPAHILHNLAVDEDAIQETSVTSQSYTFHNPIKEQYSVCILELLRWHTSCVVHIAAPS